MPFSYSALTNDTDYYATYGYIEQLETGSALIGGDLQIQGNTILNVPPNTLLCVDAKSTIKPVSIANTNGSNMSFTNGILTGSNQQDVSVGASPTFARIGLTGLTPSQLVGSDSSSKLQSLNTGSNSGCTAIVAGDTLWVDTPQPLSVTDSPAFDSLTLGLPSNTSSLVQLNTAGGTTTLERIDGTGLVLSNSPSAPTTVDDLIDNGLTASLPVHTNASKQLVSSAIALTSDVSGILGIANGGTNSSTALANGALIQSSGGKYVEGTSATSPSFSGTVNVGQIIDNGLTASLPVHTNASKQLITGAINLTTDVVNVLPVANGGTGSSVPTILPIANGGTNSSTTLGNGLVMCSRGGQIVETANALATVGLNGALSLINGSDIYALKTNCTNIASKSYIKMQIGGANAVSFGYENTSAIGINIYDELHSQTWLFQPNATPKAVATFNNVLDNGSGLMTVVNMIDSGLTASMPVKSNASKQLVSSAINVATDISGVVAIANGGTNSSTALANGALMISSGGQVVEGTSLTNPTFAGNVTVGGNMVAGFIVSNPTFGDLRMNPSATGETIYIGHDLGSVSVHVGTGVTNCTFGVSSNGINTLVCTGSNQVISTRNILDDGLGNMSLAGSVLLPTTGGTATPLSYYEEYNYSSTLTGCGTVIGAVNIHITRIGRIVTLSTQLDATWNCVSSGTMTTTTAFPSRFGVSTNHNHFVTTVDNNGTSTLADAYISISNTVFFTGTTAGGNFVGSDCVIYRFSTSWSI